MTEEQIDNLPWQDFLEYFKPPDSGPEDIETEWPWEKRWKHIKHKDHSPRAASFTRSIRDRRTGREIRGHLRIHYTDVRTAKEGFRVATGWKGTVDNRIPAWFKARGSRTQGKNILPLLYHEAGHNAGPNSLGFAIKDWNITYLEHRGTDALLKQVYQTARKKKIYCDPNKKRDFWDWRDFQHHAVMWLLMFHTTYHLDTDLKPSYIGFRREKTIRYYDSRGIRKEAPWLDVIANMTNADFRPQRVKLSGAYVEPIFESYQEYDPATVGDRYSTYADELYDSYENYGLYTKEDETFGKLSVCGLISEGKDAALLFNQQLKGTER